MRAFLRVRDAESDDGDQPGGKIGGGDGYQPASRPLLRLRCFACAGSGTLWVSDAINPSAARHDVLLAAEQAASR